MALQERASVCECSWSGNEKGNKKGEVRVKLRSAKMTEEPNARHLAYVAGTFCCSRRLKFEFVEIPTRKDREDEAVDLVPFGTL